MSIARLILIATGYVAFLSLAPSLGLTGLGGSALTTLATACTATLINDTLSHSERKADPIDLLALVAAGSILNAGAIFTGQATDMTGFNAAAFAGYGYYNYAKHDKDKPI